jgi:signal recognition particle subunit SRP54
MFETLSERLQGALNKIKGYGKITEENVSEVTREIRLALLEADVNYQVVKDFIASVKEKALGEEVRKSIKPNELFIKIVHDELVNLLNESVPLNIGKKTIIMMVGLQGSGKTTTAGKIALYLRKKESKKPLLVACDVYRPAAIDQLKDIGKQLNIDVYSETSNDPVLIAKNSIEHAYNNHNDVIIIDTAGRLHIDDNLMNELDLIKNSVNPNEILLVLDSMIGQDAINVIIGFNDKLPLTGAVLTKMDGDTKGGVALSLRSLTNVPIKFLGTSEKMDGLELFDRHRMANRILGMGDILSIVDKVSDILDEESIAVSKKMQKGDFDLEDFLAQLKQIKKMGPLENVIKMMPGANKLKDVKVNPKDLLHTEAIILSMTPYERKHPDILKASRKIRIAKGSGLEVSDVNRLLKQYEQMKVMMKQIKNGNFKLPF